MPVFFSPILPVCASLFFPSAVIVMAVPETCGVPLSVVFVSVMPSLMPPDVNEMRSALAEAEEPTKHAAFSSAVK